VYQSSDKFNNGRIKKEAQKKQDYSNADINSSSGSKKEERQVKRVS
jgi:hypothetical protein